MTLKRTTVLALTFLITGTLFLPVLWAETPGSGPPSTVRQLEDELTGIERELTGLEREIDELLEDLIDPKITSLSIFFSSQNIRGQVPVSIQVRLEDKLLASKDLDETDRLVLIRGGAIEIYSGIAEPVSHNLGVECFLTSGDGSGEVTSTGQTVFKFDTRRSAANFLEITLNQDPEKKPASFKVSARHWSREP